MCTVYCIPYQYIKHQVGCQVGTLNQSVSAKQRFDKLHMSSYVIDSLSCFGKNNGTSLGQVMQQARWQGTFLVEPILFPPIFDLSQSESSPASLFFCMPDFVQEVMVFPWADLWKIGRSERSDSKEAARQLQNLPGP